jgi:hypothetical protein
MDDLTLMRGFRAERVSDDPEARDTIRQLLEARFDAAEASAPVIPVPARRRRFRHGRRLLAFASATAVAAAVAGVLVLGSGPTAQPAAAEVLRQTATVAATAGGPSGIPGPGEFLYTRTKSLELQSWIPGIGTMGGGVISDENVGGGEAKNAFSALVSWQSEVWRSEDEPSRNRLVMDPPRFLSSTERSRWEAAGSPLPSPFEGESERNGFPESHINELRPGVMDVESQEGHGFIDVSKLPTDPEALRRAIEHRQVSDPGSGGGAAAEPIDAGRVIAELWDILDKPNTTPALRAAVFAALAEEPGIELNRDAENLVGWPGYALSYESRAASEYQQHGVRTEYIFDPDTSAILGRREIIVDPAKVAGSVAIPVGTVRREVAYLDSGLVDSTHERPHERQGEPVATTDPTYRR